MSQQRIEVTLAGQKITLATSAEHEPLLRAACVLVDEQIQLAISGGNRSIERASMMAALKIAGDLIKLQSSQTQQNTTSNHEGYLGSLLNEDVSSPRSPK